MQCSYDSLLKSHALFDGRKTILWMSYSFLEIRKTRPTCDRLAKSWTFFNRTRHGTYILCTIILQLSCVFHDVCDFVSNLIATDRSQEIVREKKTTTLRLM